MKDAYGVHNLDPSDKYRDKYSKSIRKTNKNAIKFFGSVIRWFIFFSRVPASWLTALHWGSIDLEGKKRGANSKKENDFRHEFHTKISRKPSLDYRDLRVIFFLMFSSTFY